jgi:hypothetical protein
MLISHRMKFIFIKTSKTAGTSIESYFERFCMPADMWSQQHFRNEWTSEEGIIGYRGPGRQNETWYNHMSAEKIKQEAGDEVWSEYFKFTAVRNPFDKLVSLFSMDMYRQENPNWVADATAEANGAVAKGREIQNKDREVATFRKWLASSNISSDRKLYLIDGEECVDDYIRYENLTDDIERISNQFGLPYDPQFLPKYKSGYRNREIALADYYDYETVKLVENEYAWELERFGYSAPDIA